MKLKPYLQSLGCAVMLLLAASCTDDALDNGANNGQSPEADSNVVTLTVLDGASQQGRIHTPAAPNTRALKSQRLQYVATIESTKWQDDKHVWSATSVYIDDDRKQAYITWHSDRQATNQAQMWGGALDIIDIANEDEPQMVNTLASEKDLKFNNVMENSGKLYLSAMHPRKGGVVARVDLNTPTQADLIGFPGSSVNAIALLSDGKLMAVSGFKGTYGIVSPSQLPTEYDYDHPDSDANQYVTLGQPMDKDFGGKYVAVDENGKAYVLRQNGDKGQIINVEDGKTINMSVPLLSENKYAEDYDPETGWITEGTRQSVYFGKHVMVIRKGIAYVAAGQSGLYKYDLNNNGQETRINGISTTGLYIDDEFLYAATGSGLRIYQFNDETGELPLYAFEVETYDEEGNGAPTSTTAATTGASTTKRHSPNFVTAHHNGNNTYIYIAYGQSGVRVYKFTKEGEEQPGEPEDNDWVDIGDPDIVWAKENLPGYYAWGEVFHAAHGNGDGNPYETADADGEITFTYTDAEGKEWTATNNAEYYTLPDYNSKVKYTYDNYRYFDAVMRENENKEHLDNPKTNGWIYKLTKYSLPEFNSTGDNITVLEPGDDVATMRLGNGWRMPTYEEWKRFDELCTEAKETDEGIEFSFANGEKVMLPYTGRYSSNFGDFGPTNTHEFYYWSSSLRTTKAANIGDDVGPGGWVDGADPNYDKGNVWCYESLAWAYIYENFGYGMYIHINHYDRAYGMKVRPVKDKKNMPQFSERYK